MCQNKEDTMELPKTGCSRCLFSLSAVLKEKFLQVMPLLNLKITKDVSYPQQGRQSVSSMLEQIAGMWRTGLRKGMLHHGLCTKWFFKPSTVLFND